MNGVQERFRGGVDGRASQAGVAARQRARQEADTRLLNAAPDMLAALKGVRDWADDIASPAPVFQAVRAAILKAESQT